MSLELQKICKGSTSSCGPQSHFSSPVVISHHHTTLVIRSSIGALLALLAKLQTSFGCHWFPTSVPFLLQHPVRSTAVAEGPSPPASSSGRASHELTGGGVLGRCSVECLSTWLCLICFLMILLAFGKMTTQEVSPHYLKGSWYQRGCSLVLLSPDTGSSAGR